VIPTISGQKMSNFFENRQKFVSGRLQIGLYRGSLPGTTFLPIFEEIGHFLTRYGWNHSKYHQNITKYGDISSHINVISHWNHSKIVRVSVITQNITQFWVIF
jgi:hypothetical protein